MIIIYCIILILLINITCALLMFALQNCIYKHDYEMKGCEDNFKVKEMIFCSFMVLWTSVMR